MNKLFSKVAALSAGLALAIGVGVAVGSKEAKVAKADEANGFVADGNGKGTTGTGSEMSVSSNNITFTFSKGFGYSSTQLRSYAGGTISLSFTSDVASISSIVMTTTAADKNGGTWSGGASVSGTTVTWSSFTSGTVVSHTAQARITDITVTYEAGTADVLESITVTGSMTKTSYTTAQSWDPAGLVATGHYESGADKDVTNQVEWTYSPSVPAVEVTSVIATAAIGNVNGSSAAQAVTVSVAHAGTAEDPFTVAEALAKCAEIGAVGNVGQGPWVTKGIITRVTSAPAATYWNATYFISDDGSETNELQVYRGFYLDNAKFDAETALLLKAGKVATITGNLTGSYGSEYCQGNYLLALEEQETGDVDVVFEPSETSIEIGATGTYTATSNTAGVVFTWSSDNPDVLSVNETTGEFEALSLGVARITVTATANDKEGSTYANITVNGNSAMTVDEAVALAATLPSGQTTSYYVYVAGFVKEFGTSKSDKDEPRAFDIQCEEQDSSIMVYTNVNSYEGFIEGLALGSYIEVKANVQNYKGTYELTNPVKISSDYVAMTFAYELLNLTDAVCKDYDGATNNHDAIEAIWETLTPKYEGLNSAQQARLVNPTLYGCGETVKNAMARYDYLTGKYSLENFISGRTPIVPAGAIDYANAASNSTIIIVISIATISTLAFTMLLVFKKKKQK